MISIVAPILNEEQEVAFFLDNLNDLEGSFEVILVDGGSQDHTLDEVAENVDRFSHPISLLQCCQGRAVQMNRGALEAKGEILLFLHSDCRIPRDALKIIEGEVLKKGVVGGGFKHMFSKPSDVFLRFLSGLGNVRSRLTEVFFGDYGIFLRRDVFKKIGGYDETRFLEDVELCGKARKCGRLSQIDRYILSSPRRFLVDGELEVSVAYVVTYALGSFGFRPSFLKKYFVREGQYDRLRLAHPPNHA